MWTSRRATGDHRRNGTLLRLGVSVVLTLLMVAAAPTVGGDGPLANLEAQSLNLRFRLRGPVQPGPEVALVMIDEKTVGTYGRWPLPRERLAETVRRLKSSGAAVIGFDLLFLEDAHVERLPAWAEAEIRAALADGSRESALEELLSRNPTADVLVEAIQSAANVVVPYAFVADARQPDDLDRSMAIVGSAFSTVRAPGDAAAPLEASHLLAPEDDLLKAAASSAHVTVALASDGYLRRHHPVIHYREAYFPSLPVEIARLFLGVPRHETTVLLGSGIVLGDRFLPADRRTRFLVDYYGPEETFPTYSLVDVLEHRVPEQAFRGRIVLVGASATGASDSFPTPYTATFGGTEYFATVIGNILDARLLRRDDTTAGYDILGILVGGLLAGIAGYLAPLAVSAAIALLLLVSWGVVTYAAFATAGLWLGFVVPSAAILLNFGVQGIWTALVERRRRRSAERQRLNLSRYFAPSIVEALAHRDEAVTTTRSQDAAVLFVDLAGFTGLCERLPPEEAMTVLRSFHRLVEEAVFAHDGTLDKFIGDAALAVFGVPVSGKADSANALRCARRLLEDLANWNAGLDGPHETVEATIGVHFGPVLAGDVGGERQFQYTVTGDTVNVASRLQSLCGDLGVRLVASEAVVDAARSSPSWSAMLTANLEHLPCLHLRGRQKSIAAWIGPKEPT